MIGVTDLADVKLQNITKQFHHQTVLDNISFDVKDKEFFVIFGHAGAGKTTILNTIAGLYAPDSGQVLIDNREVTGVEPEDRNIAMVFENYALYPHYTVFENIASPLKSPKHRQPQRVIEEKVIRTAKKLNIDHLLDRKPSELSNGQRQRVGLGRALVREPEAFLMDEPLTHLDAKLRHQMRAELKEMQYHLDTTTVYVTHDYLEAMSLGDRIAILNEGKIEQIGTPHDIYYFPASEYVAQAFGEPEINLLEGHVQTEHGKHWLAIHEIGEDFLLPEDVSRTLLERGARVLSVGLRPTDIDFSRTDENGGLPGTVYSFEPLGAKAILSVKVKERIINTVTSADEELNLDERVFLKIHLDRAVFFDRDDGKFLARSKRKGGIERGRIAVD
ncbi:ABC transporter ATP-binding protein [Novibacillus thermophilus]|uniref:ABC transporter ATP-binding protein n=1 Tax=Novibacillus thermophilus TaxID=1471761 RepID=UPI001E578B7D|nr:ABC transporter ATP-binding protein [Novibacillus thermophilus]